MDGLRWLLLLFGLLVILGVYFYSRRERDKTRPAAPAPAPDARVEPSFDASEDFREVDADSEQVANDFEETTDGEAPRPKEKIVTMRLIAKHQGAFAGDELVLGLRGIGMRHGKFGIFHRYEEGDENKVVFSAASLVEPGSFDLANLKEQRIPGISLFMVLPGPIDGAQGFDLMVAAGRTLSKSLNAELLDESGSTFSIQREHYLREEIIQYQHGIKVA